eukprot:3093035-Rhodomonas_salina.1
MASRGSRALPTAYALRVLAPISFVLTYGASRTSTRAPLILPMRLLRAVRVSYYAPPTRCPVPISRTSTRTLHPICPYALSGTDAWRTVLQNLYALSGTDWG